MSREAFVELIRKNFAALPPRSILLLKPRETEGSHLSEITLENTPAVFSWGKKSGFSGLIVLGLEKGGDGLLDFRIQRLSPDETERRREVPQQITLAKGLRALRWEFFDEEDRRWVELWDNRARKPNLVRLNFQFQGDTTPVQVTFALPWTSARNATQEER
jgi:hypothetical protein